jgi:hypothetical protein
MDVSWHFNGIFMLIPNIFINIPCYFSAVYSNLVRQSSLRSRWRQSSGSKMEIALAKSLGLDIKFLRNRKGLAKRS